MPTIYDNILNQLTNGLNQTLDLSIRADFCVGYFNLRGWKEVVDKIDKLIGDKVIENEDECYRYCRLLVGMQKTSVEILRESYHISNEDVLLDQQSANNLRKKLAQDFRQQLTIGTPTEDDEATLRRLSQQMKDGKVAVKLHLRYLLHAKLYLAFSKDFRVPKVGFLGSSNLTLAGLSKQGELNIDVLDQDAAGKLAQWFNDRWEDRWCIDITNELIEIIDTSWAADRLVPPFHIYLKMAYHLSQEARAGLSEFKIPAVFRKVLLPFQQSAVLIAAKKLNLRNGVFIGDVVGLGKTMTACALAKIYEEDFFYSTLIICPPNLQKMWLKYVNAFDMKANILSIGKVQSQLPDLRRYKLVIIDESHNLRNDEGSRYRAIKAYLDENECKVILLSATPYNKTFQDLSNQLRLFIPDDKDLGISPENYISQIGGQVQFLAKHTETFIRSIKAFEKSDFADDWRELMRLFMVRRTRSFIKDNYALTDPDNGRKFLLFSDGSRSYFPDRIPKKVDYKFDPDDPRDQYARLYSQSVVDTINHLELPRYGLKNYILDHPPVSPTNEEKVIIDNLSRAGRRLMGFCRTNLFKRLESSGYSFLLSLSRHILRNYVFIYALENKLPLPIGKNISQNLDVFLEDEDTDQEPNEEGNNDDNLIRFKLNEADYLVQSQKAYELFRSHAFVRRFDWINSELFAPSLIKVLINDCKEIIKILARCKEWNPAEDRQLNALHDLVATLHKNEKVLIFTQFADTASYLSQQLLMRGVGKLHEVTGDSEDPTELAYRFSPVSNEQVTIKGSSRELRVLVATDVLSEGQNLQDAHIILNYDLPWAIIRLIQRAGRVDRIGQQAEKITCYSFLPEDGLERIINLRRRLRNRIRENAEVVGSDEVFFDGDPVNLEDLYNEKAGILDDEADDGEVDLASYAFQIWKNAIDANPQLKKLIPELPNVIYSTKENTFDAKHEGVIVYTRTADENDVLAWMNTKGEIITQSQLTILKAAACNAATPAQYKIQSHHELVRKAVEYVMDDEKSTGGSLGKRTGVKYRVYMRLDRYCKDNEGTLFVNEPLKRAVDDILKYPLKEFARETLSRQMKSGISDEDLAELVVSLRDEDKLCIIDLDEQPVRDPQIICSLGLINIS